MESAIRQAEWKIGAYIFAAALAARLLFLCQYANAPFFWVPSLDALYHDLLARGVAAGRPEHEAFFRAPLYYYFLGGIYWLFGHNFWAARLVQAAIGAGSCLLLYRIGLRVFRPGVALLAAGMMALYGPLVFFDGELLTPVLEVFLDLAFLLLALRAMESRSRRHWVAAGLLLGLSAVTRPNVLVAIPVVAVAIWTSERAHPGRSIRAALGATGLFLAAAALIPACVTLRNCRVSGDPVFIASQGGINLYLGNRPEADGFTPSTPRRYRFTGPYEDSVALYGQRAAEEAAGHPLSASAAQRYWLRRVLQWWQQDPEAALALTGKKSVLAWTHREIRNNHAYDFIRAEFAPCLWFYPFGFWLAGPLGLFGMALAVYRPRAHRCFLVAFVLIYIASFVLFFVADRYRLPVVPLLLLFSAHALVWLAERLRGAEWTRLAPAAAALATAALFVNVDWFQTVTPATRALDYWTAGNAYQSMGHLTQAEAEHRKALALDPHNPEIWTNLGVDQFGAGHVRQAAGSFQQAIALAPPSGTAYYDLAVCELQLGRPQQARRLLQQALQLDPEYTTARAALARLEGRRQSPVD